MQSDKNMLEDPKEDPKEDPIDHALLDSYAKKCEVIAKQLESLPAYADMTSFEQEGQRLALENSYADNSIEYEKLKLLRANLIPRNTATIASSKRCRVEAASTTSHCLTEDYTMLDCLPDLALMLILSQFANTMDVRRFYMALGDDRKRIEGECIKRLRECWRLTNFDAQYCVVCEGGYCRNPVMCLRCYLNCQGKCMTCDAPIDLAIDEMQNIYKCNSTLVTDTAQSCKCEDVLKCARCGFKYTVQEQLQIGRTFDFDCDCGIAKGNEGCVNCSRECSHCANVGCFSGAHFRVNKLLIMDENLWPKCEDCERPHCCAFRDKQEWDYCACPTYESCDGQLEHLHQEQTAGQSEQSEQSEQTAGQSEQSRRRNNPLARLWSSFFGRFHKRN